MDQFTKILKKHSYVIILFIIGFIVISIFTFFSCKDQTTQNHSSNIVFPPSGITFSKYVGPLFQQTCLGSQCHSDNNVQGVIDLETNAYQNIMYPQPGQINLVIIKNGNNSPLVMYLDGRMAPQMPLRQQPLTTNQITGVKTWIDEGGNP